MTDPVAVQKLEELHAAISVPFISYLVETSGVEVRDDHDRKCMAFLEEWSRSRRSFVDEATLLLAREGVFPRQGVWPLEFFQYNYLAAGYVLGPLGIHGTREVEALSRYSADLALWPEAAALVRAQLERERAFLARALALSGEKPKAAPSAPRPKGTSAARW